MGRNGQSIEIPVWGLFVYLEDEKTKRAVREDPHNWKQSLEKYHHDILGKEDVDEACEWLKKRTKNLKIGRSYYFNQLRQDVEMPEWENRLNFLGGQLHLFIDIPNLVDALENVFKVVGQVSLDSDTFLDHDMVTGCQIRLLSQTEPKRNNGIIIDLKDKRDIQLHSVNPTIQDNVPFKEGNIFNIALRNGDINMECNESFTKYESHKDLRDKELQEKIKSELKNFLGIKETGVMRFRLSVWNRRAVSFAHETYMKGVSARSHPLTEKLISLLAEHAGTLDVSKCYYQPHWQTRCFDINKVDNKQKMVSHKQKFDQMHDYFKNYDRRNQGSFYDHNIHQRSYHV